MDKEVGNKRSIDDVEDSSLAMPSSVQKPRASHGKEHISKIDRNAQNVRLREKSHSQLTNELYVNLTAEMMYPKIVQNGYGFNPEQGKFPFERLNTLGFLLSPIRTPTVMEKWNPFEIAVFEGSIMLYGKNFHSIQKHVGTKTVKEIIEFYYEWKKTSHYKEWKKQYQPDERDFIAFQ